MKKLLFKVLLFSIFTTTIVPQIAKGIEANGYIITEKWDTVFGTVRLSKFQNGRVLLNGFDLETLQYQVSFRGKDDRKYRTHYPGTIAGFGFTYEYEDYSFTSFVIDYKSVVPNDKQRNRFLCRVYHGKLNLYRNIITVNNPSAFNNQSDFTTFYEFFLQNSTKGLLKVQRTKEIQSIRDLLRQFDVDEKFIGEVPMYTDMDEIRKVLQQYDKWLAMQNVAI